MKRANGSGTIIKLSGNRRRPWAIRRVAGWKENGHPIIKYQGYYRTKREAETALNEYNCNPYTISRKTFEDVYKEWYATKESQKAEATLKGYRICFGHLAQLHDMRIQDIDEGVLQAVYEKADISALTLKKTMQLVNMVFDYAVKRKILPLKSTFVNKGVLVPQKGQDKPHHRTALTSEEINLLWKNKDDEYAKIALVYVYTGLRFSELQNLTPDCCHENYIEIRQSKTAAGIRIVPLCDKVKDLLPIIPVPPRTTFERKFRYFLPNHYIHETRHTFITMLTEAGVDSRIIKAIVGHKPNDITEHYTHISLEVMLEAVNRL